jgi:hypothetical protein
MKRHICAAAGVVLLALAGAGNAAADDLPILGQTQLGSQSVSHGEQTVGEQTNDADVTQAQGNGNLNVSPAISIGGDASTSNAQGNGNTAEATVVQANEAAQSQAAEQGQLLEQAGSKSGCCDGRSQTGEQRVSGGEQTIGEQENDADVRQSQGNGNVNVSPAVSIGGDASTSNAQGNGNEAAATVVQANEAGQSQRSSQRQGLEQSGDGQSQAAEQQSRSGDQTVEKQANDADVSQKQGNGNLDGSPAVSIGGDASTRNAQGNVNEADAAVVQANEARQSQSSTQWQKLSQKGGDCCKPRYGDGKKHDGKKTREHGKRDDRKRHCCDGKRQAGGQKAVFGDQKVGKQRNEADVGQKQGNRNVNVSPALGLGGHDRGSCDEHRKHGEDACVGKSGHGGRDADASTRNAQGNGNEASASVVQGSSATQSQSTTQAQRLVQACKEVVIR